MKKRLHQLQQKYLPLIWGLTIISFMFAVFYFINYLSEPSFSSSLTESDPSQQIDTTLKPVFFGKYRYQNSNPSHQTSFRKDPTSSAAIHFANQYAGLSFFTNSKQSFATANTKTKLITDKNIIVYPDLFPDTDLRYTITPTRLLEEFIVHNKNTALNMTEISQTLDRHNIDSYQEVGGTIELYKDQQLVATIPRPVMYEANNQANISYDLSYSIEEIDKNTLKITKIINQEGLDWLNDSSRSYPIAIDLVIDNADTAASWVSSDPTNTTVSQETSIKHSGTGSVKVQTTAGALPLDADLFEYANDHAARATAATNTISATGGTITYSGGYTIHTFTSSGTFTVSSGSGDVEVLVVAGGGGGGSDMGGGGGGGGVIYDSDYAVTPTGYTVTVGAGGAGAPAGQGQVRGTNGSNSVFGTITATGGGGGASNHDLSTAPAGNGGSGGGASGGAQPASGGHSGSGGYGGSSRGTGTAGQGYDGSWGIVSWYPGGGGGAGGPGVNRPGNGGSGYQSSINGTNLYYGGGGGGAGYNGIAGNGGLGGGGGGAPKVAILGGGEGGDQALNAGQDGEVGTLNSQTNKHGGDAGANTGGGGGGGSHYNSTNTGGDGGSGVVIVRYPTTGYATTGYISSDQGLKAHGGDIIYSGGYKIHMFRDSGSFNIISGSGNVEVLVVAGGGGGGSDMGGGGGGGGVIYDSAYAVTPSKMEVTVGDGGAGAPAGQGQVRGTNGSNSVFGTITATGGGGGASNHDLSTAPAGNGGSGGGASGGAQPASGGHSGSGGYGGSSRGTGTAGQGYDGSWGIVSWYPGGGGGAGGAGGTNPGNGGVGYQSSITGSALYYGGGGGGAGYNGIAGIGGLGGGGGGAPKVSGGGLGGGSALKPGGDGEVGTLNSQTNKHGGDAGANTGGGGGGGAHYNSTNTGGDGGSGVVIIRYPIPPLEVFSSVAFAATGGNETTSGGNSIHTFLTSGTLSVASGSEYIKNMIIGGGGGAGSDMGGGGGAGGYIYNSSYPLVAGSYKAVVGAGGGGAPAGQGQVRGTDGQKSSFDTTIALGGGGGASNHDLSTHPAGNGGSGGGASGGAQSPNGGHSSTGGYGGSSRGTGTVGQGYDGSWGIASWYPGGGGGAGGAGSVNPGNGGVGVQNDITGTNLYWAAGGGGAGYNGIAGNGGLGGGGGGAPKVSGGGLGGGSALNAGQDGEVGTLNSQTNKHGGDAGANTGGGGGGGSHYNSTNTGGDGGSGIVVVSYPTPTGTIKTEGSYALKGVARATTSLNKTLTRTVASPYDFSGTTTAVTFDLRASRTGSNIKVGLHDAGGTTTEITPNITVADTFQAVSIDLTGVASADKDAIDQIIITIVNADADNTFYIDNMKSVIPSSITDTVTLTKSATDLSNTPSINFWVRSDTTGSFARIQFGESASSEQTHNFTIDAANTWEQKLWDISGITGTDRDAVTKFAFEFTADAGGAILYFDYLTGGPPNTPSLDTPTDTATNQSLTPVFKTTATDDGENYLRYKIQVCEDVGMTTGCNTHDQTSSQTGWSGQNTQSSTAYTSGTQATYTLQTPLSASTTYYWRSYAIDPGGSNTWSSTQGTPYSFTTTTIPTAPTTPYTEGASNPSGVTDITPEFSAIHNDPNGDSANYYQVEVNTAVGFDGTSMWDSGKTSMTTTANGVRSPNISYAGTALSLDASTYYWRIKFWDTLGAQGTVSATQNFTMNVPVNTPSLDSPLDTATSVSILPALKTTATDTDSDYLRYKVQICENSAMTLNCNAYDQTSSQTGWSGQDVQSNTAYASDTQATYTLQVGSELSTVTNYYWRSYAIDPVGTNAWSSTQSPVYSFTTTDAPVAATNCRIEEAADDSSNIISWTDVAGDEDHYEVERSEDGGGWVDVATNLDANITSHQDSTITTNHTYRYRVAPYFNGPVYGAWCYTSTLDQNIGTFSADKLIFEGVSLD